MEEKNVLTKQNYATNHFFMSYSRLCRFKKCEAAAAAGYHEPTTTSQLVGSYVDAYFSDELEDFKKEHPEILNSRTGQLKADFLKAEDLIKRIESDEIFMDFMSGEKQVIMTGNICGYPFKIKIDSYLKDRAIVDLKVVKDFNKVWSDSYGGYYNFIEAWDYDIEMAIFQEIVFQNTGKKLPCYIAAITKEDPSDIGIFEIPQENLDLALLMAKDSVPRIKKILEGVVRPNRCEKCSYCRSTKKAKVLSYDLAGLNGLALSEKGIDCTDPIVKKEEK